MNKAIIGLGALLISGAASAVPWCHNGNIYSNFANKSFSYAELSALKTQMQNDGTIPSGHPNPDYYVAFTAAHDYSNNFIGGVGPNWSGASNHGQVRTRYTGPYSFTNTLNGYNISHGLNATYDKCSGGYIMVKVEKRAIER